MMVEIMERAPTTDLPKTEIAENFSAIMLAGFHTTQNALCAAIYFVLTHPEAHAKLKAELDSVYSAPKDIDGQVQKLPYLNAVITEAMRLYPPVPVGGPRVSPGAYVDGTYIPAGVSSPTFPETETLTNFDRLKSAPHCSPFTTTPNTSTPHTSSSPSAGQTPATLTAKKECRHSWSVAGLALPSILRCR